MSEKFGVDIRGRIANFDFPRKDALMPLYEAVVNSIHSLDECQRDNKYIEIEVQREECMDIENMEEISPIRDFTIKDNGEGFNHDNYKSFLTSDSTLKYKKGGKGIGRYTWLKAFSNVHIESVFDQDDNRKRRVFDFNLNSGDPIQNEFLEVVDTSCEFITEIKLQQFKSRYANAVLIGLDEIASRLTSHCIQFLLSESCPTITIKDGTGLIVINDKFTKEFHIGNTDSFNIKGKIFNVLHTKNYEDTDKHRIHLCAHNRVVKNLNIEKYIPNLAAALYDDEKYSYSVYVTGDYLDENVASNRTGFDMPTQNGLFDIPTFEEIENELTVMIEEYLSNELHEIERQKIEHIEKYTSLEEPRYKYLLKRCPDKIKKLKPNVHKKTLASELAKIDMEYKIEMEEERKEIFKKVEYGSTEYFDRLDKYLERITEYNQSELAQYVLHRKVVLEVLETIVSLDDDGKFGKEKQIHKLIFPMNATSDEVGFENHNLWLIDEKLSFHRFLTSDKQLDPNRKRPDIIVGNSFVDSEKPYDSITVVELKRPGRNDYNDEYNPIQQLIDYTKLIRKNDKKDGNGRPISVTDGTRYYLYAICDSTKSLESSVINYDLQPTPDNLGFYTFNKTLNAYIEVITLDKLIQDAKSKNKMLFNKLGL